MQRKSIPLSIYLLFITRDVIIIRISVLGATIPYLFYPFFHDKFFILFIINK
jgi:hypothetical protein